MKVRPAELSNRAEELRRDGQTVMSVVVGASLLGLVGVADPIKKSTPEAIQLLHRKESRIVMLTGDNRTTAEAVARSSALMRVQAEVLPEQKGEVVKRLQAEGRWSRWQGTESTMLRLWPRHT